VPSARRIAFLIFLCVFTAIAAHAQAEEDSLGPRFTWPEIPQSPYDPVTGPLQRLTTPTDRTRAFDLLNRARENYRFDGLAAAPFSMEVSFVASGNSKYEGQGTMTQTYLDAGHHVWEAHLAGNTSGRVVSMGRRGAIGGSEEIPLRVQMVRSAIFAPVKQPVERVELRTGTVSFHGEQLTCVLFAARLDDPSAYRNWREKEYCVDAQSGLLRLWSATPGIYAVYDYSRAINWNGHTIAGEITFYEDSGQVLQIHVESFGPPTMTAADLRPASAPERNASGNGGLEHFTVVVRPDGAQTPAHGSVTPVIVHAAIATNGTVLESEVLTPVDPELAQLAISHVRKCGCSNFQTEAIFLVAFVSPQ
jgi:hypothetical protein